MKRQPTINYSSRQTKKNEEEEEQARADAVEGDEFNIEDIELEALASDLLSPLQKIKNQLASEPIENNQDDSMLSISSFLTYYNDIDPQIVTEISENIHNNFHIKEDQWFEFSEKKQYHKLLLENRIDGQFVFVNQEATKSLTLSSVEFKQKLENNTLCPVVEPALFQQALTYALKQMKPFVQKSKTKAEDVELKTKTFSKPDKCVQIEEKSQSNELTPRDGATDENHETVELIDLNEMPILDDVEILIEENENHNESLLSQPTSQPADVNTRRTNFSSESEGSTTDLEMFDINRLTVGSWVEVEKNNNQLKCKLAAKINTKDLYIFVDRQGKKVMELSSEKIVRMVNDKQLKMVILEVQNDQLLASLITKTRTLKS